MDMTCSPLQSLQTDTAAHPASEYRRIFLRK